MIFPYTWLDAGSPVRSPGNIGSRLRPLLDVLVAGPTRIAQFHRGTLDSGSDDTVFPTWLAVDLGVDLTNAPMRRGKAVGGRVVEYRYVEVELRIIDDLETYTWDAVVGFGDAIGRGLLGHAGFMQYFDIEFLGQAKQVIIEPNSSLPGLRRELNLP